MSVWTVKSLLDWTVEYFTKYAISSPRHEAEYLLSAMLGTSRTGVYLNFDRPITDQELADFKSWIVRRKNNEPLQYIIGKAFFMGLEFAVGKGCFIPRFATETVVEKVIEYAKKIGSEHVKIYEIGGGSGAIAVSCAYFLRNIHVTVIEKNPVALEYIKTNSMAHNVTEQISIVEGDFWDIEKLPSCDILVSNPPYIAYNDRSMLAKEVDGFEPHDALYAGDDGLDFYRMFAKRHASTIAKGTVIFFEIGYNQADAVGCIFEPYGFSIEVYKDLEHHDRVVCIRRKNE